MIEEPKAHQVYLWLLSRTYISGWVASDLNVGLIGKRQHDVARVDDLLLEDEGLSDRLVSNFLHLGLGLVSLVGSLVLLGGQRAGLAEAGNRFCAVMTCNVTVQIIGRVGLKVAEAAHVRAVLVVVGAAEVLHEMRLLPESGIAHDTGVRAIAGMGPQVNLQVGLGGKHDAANRTAPTALLSTAPVSIAFAERQWLFGKKGKNVGLECWKTLLEPERRVDADRGQRH